MSTAGRSGRSVQLTEKGSSYKLGLYQEQRAESQSKVYVQIKLLVDIIKPDEEIDKDFVFQEAEKLKRLHKEFSALHAKCQILLEGEEGRLEEDLIAEKVDQDVDTIYTSWLSLHHVSPTTSRKAPLLKSKSSKSSRSSKRSSKSSTRLSDKLAEERARLAELKIETIYRSELEKKDGVTRNGNKD